MRELNASYGRTGMGLDTILCNVLPGTMIVGHDVDADGQYYVSWHSNLFFPFDSECRYMLGEWTYGANQPLVLEPIDDAGAAALTS